MIVQFGGQTPLNLAVPLERAGVPIIGTPPDSIDRAEDRERFEAVLEKLGLAAAAVTASRAAPTKPSASPSGSATRCWCGRRSCSAGARWMIVYDEDALREYMRVAVEASPEHPVLVDHFLDDAIEVDVDAICDGERVVIGGIMEHIEEAGVHSGDSACSIPPYSLAPAVTDEITRATRALALRTERARPDERAVRREGRRRLRAGSEPARVAHGAVRQQGDRRAAGEARGAGDGRPLARRTRLHSRNCGRGTSR